MKKRRVTLIEVLISISLLSIVLFALLSSYSQLKMVDSAIAKEIDQGFETRHLESRLQSLFLQTLSAGKNNFFYIEQPAFSNSPSLIFSYDAHAMLDPRFSGQVLGRLFVDPENRLILATWPSPLRYRDHPIPMETSILAKGIESIGFLFFAPPSKELGKVDPEPNKWHPDWKKSYEKVPPLMKIQLIKTSSERIEFSFYLPNTQYPLKI